ncbi:hypothetical protein [Acinetobacter gerneri]|uniref:hypothetical protein n=1 Tax=Acinetobacter gerneri TaxID=202952 RepID=UPI003A871BC4
MIIYVCDYVIREPFITEHSLDIKQLGLEELLDIVKKVYTTGGSVLVRKTDAQISEEYGGLDYDDIDRYSMVCDPRYGYLLGCSIDQNEGFPNGTYLSLINKEEKDPEKNYVFDPYDDEWQAKYVNQDIKIALNVFKEIYDLGELSAESKKLFICNNST